MKIKIFTIILLLSIVIKIGATQTNIEQNVLTNRLIKTNNTLQSNVNKIILFNNNSNSNIKENNVVLSSKKKKFDYFEYIWKSSICPGLGQFFLNRKIKAVIFYTSFVTSISLGLYFHFDAEKTYQDYIKERDIKSVTKLYDDYIMKNQTANTFFYLSVGLWVYNIIDVVLDVHWLNNNIENKGGNIYGTVYKKRF